MDRLEQQLRATLADERLTVPLRPDATRLVHAGVRRRRRQRALAAVASAVVLLGGGVATASLVSGSGGNERIVPPTGGGAPSGKPARPAPTQTELGWDAVSYDYHHPPAFAGAIADPSIPWCRAGALSLSQSFQGATGSLMGTVAVANTSASACALQGQPAVSMQTADGHPLLTSRPEPFFVDAWIKLAPGHTAAAAVTWFPEFCHVVPVGRVSVTLPHGGGALSTGMQHSPRCDVDTLVPMVGHLDVGGFLPTQNVPFTPLAGLQATLDKVPATVQAGSVLAYRLQLQSMDAPSVTLDPCLPYRERLVDHATGVVLYEQDFLLNDCGASPPIAIHDPQSNQSTYFDLRYDVPLSAPPGDYDLVWQSVLKPVNAVSDDVIHVASGPPACRDGQLRAGAGATGAGLGSYYDVIVFRNISATTCSLYGFPGVQLTDADGRGVPTRQQRDFVTPHLVVLAPGATASATISGADSGPNGGATACKPFAGVLVIAPGQRHQTLVRGVGDRCYDTVSIWPVVAGTRGSLNSP